MPHRGLRCAERDASGAEVRSKGHPQRVHINDAVAFVTLGETSDLQVPVEDTSKTGWNAE